MISKRKVVQFQYAMQTEFMGGLYLILYDDGTMYERVDAHGKKWERVNTPDHALEGQDGSTTSTD